MNAKFNNLRPIIWTENLQQTLDFYSQVLGFTIVEQNDDWEWASVEKDEVQIMFSKPNQHEVFQKIGFTGSFYFNIDSVDDLWENLKTKAKICYPIENFDWEMREFAIYDNNGYILQFGQPV